MIKGLLFDYGGTIDTNGLHWAVVLKAAYQKFNIQVPNALFSKAYSYGERNLAINPLVKPSHNFYEVLCLKIKEQFDFLRDNGFHIDSSHIELIANHCNQFAKETVANAKPILEHLSADYPLIMVSNFYGNLNAVLEDFGIRNLFLDVIESAVVGVRKPSSKIYQLGIDRLELLPSECLVIGDSFIKDILPAKEIGCRTIWLRRQGWEDDLLEKSYDGVSDIEITDFKDIKKSISSVISLIS